MDERQGTGPADGADGSSGSLLTLDDSVEEVERALTMAELKAKLERERSGEGPGARASASGRPGSGGRDDELLVEFPATDHHLGRFAGWRATRKLRWIVSASLGLAVLAALIVFWLRSRELEHARLHPLPELEATIAPGTPRDMTYTDGSFRVAISRDAPAVNLVHLPDRDITLARGAEKAQFKVEIRDNETVKLVVLTGEIVETLTRPGAQPLLD